ncbi:MAG: tetratricopeptide repeat protein [Luteolibacter sp.]|uniref:tetratricopeptide repeat protein n=1 Tax=Luteolibacter sp. TaxID=1962973 RepID=UPI003266C9FF
MLSSRPVIFISAVSRELHSARDLVAKTLISLGYEPKWQDIAPTDTGDLLAVLRKWVDQSQAVIQIVGYRYGDGPKTPDPDFGQISYTQYEALYARQKGKPVWYIILDENHPVDPADPEPAELRQLQETYRIQVRAHGNLYHGSSDLLHTENIVLRLRDDLAKLRRRARQWAAAIVGLLLLALGGIGWMVLKQKGTVETLDHIAQQNAQLLAAVRALPAAVAEAHQVAPQEDPIARAYVSLEEGLKLPPGTLAKQLPGFAKKLILQTDTSELDRANALFVTQQFAEAEAAALRAKDRSLAAAGQPIKDAIAALVLAGQSATEQVQYERALAHYYAAAALTSEEQDLMEWVEVQNDIGWLLYLSGQYDEQARVSQCVWKAGQKETNSEKVIFFLRSHSLWANALYTQGKYAEAEREHRAILTIEERVLGLEDPATLMSRMNLASALLSQGKYLEAETGYHTVLAIRERILGPQHRDTITSRVNFAGALYSQYKYREAEQEYRAVLPTMERVLGAEHPDTLKVRGGIANILNARGKNLEAEKEHRAILTDQERKLGSDHPDTLITRTEIAGDLASQGRHADAEKEYRGVLPAMERVLGAEHPDTLFCRMTLGTVLHSQGKYVDAENEYRLALTIQEQVLGKEHLTVIANFFNLALCLESQGKRQHGLEFAKRALEGWKKVLGEENEQSKNAKLLVKRLGGD